MSEEYDLILAGGKVIDPASGLSKIGDIYIKGKKIAKIEAKNLLDSKRSKKSKDDRIIDASGKIVTPGLIDMHVHLREPGREDEETIYTGSQAAAAGGFTCICCMPNTEPPIDDQESVNFVYEKARKALCKVFCVGAATKGLNGEELTEMADLKEAGAVAVSDDGKPISNSRIMRNALDYSRMLGWPVISHCEDLDLSSGGVMNESYTSTLLGLPGIPSLAEEIMVSRDLRLAEFTGGRVHIAHVSTRGSVELIRAAKKKGVKITSEATPHHFSLTDEIIKTFNTNARVNPPLRTQKDVEEIKKGLRDGTIDCIATDHAPHSIEEKDVEFGAAPPGMVGLETALGLVITELVNKKILSWEEAVAKMTVNPARILNLNLGRIEVGGSADLTVVDPKTSWTVDISQFKSKSKNSPFEGRKLTGRAWMTIVDGKIVHRL
ncbi:dihydroorotase [candidate division WOR-1 bacterium DG_54_3]|uniref:Dihydroorotase n=1 Tax=candidate division WOR-1 bacterium DG_54_3 TaxID=1703775 RepID=A0A0S7XU86_UNCSA|nr:MAG: dihydroorotase [candidate division WOR-1 bacterium DG_54_3]